MKTTKQKLKRQKETNIEMVVIFNFLHYKFKICFIFVHKKP